MMHEEAYAPTLDVPDTMCQLRRFRHGLAHRTIHTRNLTSWR